MRAYIEYDAIYDQDTDPTSCFDEIYGCTNSIAFNYNADANDPDDDTVPI